MLGTQIPFEATCMFIVWYIEDKAIEIILAVIERIGKSPYEKVSEAFV